MMEWNKLPTKLFFLSMLGLVTLSFGKTSNCSLYYLTQPPDELPCNPYYSDYELVLECNVARNPRHPSENFIVEWYKRPNGQSPERIVDGLNGFQVETTQGPNSNGRRSLLRFPNPVMQRLSAGQYWCQLLVDSSGSGVSYIPLQSSRKTTILDPDDYFEFLPCPNTMLHTAQGTCADLAKPGPSSTPKRSTHSVVNTTWNSITASHNQLLPSPVQSSVPDTPHPFHGSPGVNPGLVCPPGLESGKEFPLVAVIAVAVGVPILLAIIILIFAVVLTNRKKQKECNRKKNSGKLDTSELQLCQSTVSLATVNSQETEEDSLSLSSRATLMSRVSARSILPAQISMTPLPSESTCHTKRNNNGEAVKVVERLRTACTGSMLPNGDHEQSGTEYKPLEPTTQERKMYDCALDPTTKDIVIRDGQVCYSLVPRTNNDASTEYTETKSMNTQLRNQKQRRGLERGDSSRTDSTSSYMYTVPGHISSPRNYQGIQPERKDYLSLYMTPYTQWESGQKMEVGGHMYQLPNPSSMEPLNIYTIPDSREGSVDY